MGSPLSTKSICASLGLVIILGELVLFCLDAEQISIEGVHGVDDLMVELYKEHGTIDNRDGIDYKDIRTKLTSMKGGRLWKMA